MRLAYICLRTLITTLHQIVNAFGRTYVSNSETNIHASPITIIEQGHVRFSIRFLHKIHCRVANVTQLLLFESNQQKLETTKIYPNHIHVPCSGHWKRQGLHVANATWVGPPCHVMSCGAARFVITIIIGRPTGPGWAMDAWMDENHSCVGNYIVDERGIIISLTKPPS